MRKMKKSKTDIAEVALFSLSTILFLTVLFLYSIYFVSAFSGDGGGTPEDPYQITNCNQLQEMKDNLFSYYALMNDIDCSDTINWNDGEGFQPIGTEYSQGYFMGEFNGNNHVITNLYIKSSTSSVGLFGYCKFSNIHNVGLENAVISGVGNVGGLVGVSYGEGNTISESYVKGDIRCSNDRCGGLVGDADITLISDSYSQGSVIGEGSKGCVGGLVGNYGNIVNSYSTSYVSGFAGSIGGLVGCGGTCASSYWDIENSSISHSSCGIGKTKEEMMQKATFAEDWDFIKMWRIDNGVVYPYFLWEDSSALDSDGDSFPDSTDCAPFDSEIYPGAEELCDGIDNNCNDQIDEELTKESENVLGLCSHNVETCLEGVWSESLSNYNPEAEICDGLDNDCNGEIDDGVKNTYYRDYDKDGFGSPLSTIQSCAIPTGYVLNNLDCNDNKATINPGAIEICNGFDDDCNGTVDEGFNDTNNNGLADCVDSDDDNDGILDTRDRCSLENPNGLDANRDGCVDRLSGLSGVVGSFPDSAIPRNLKSVFSLQATIATNMISRGRTNAAVLSLRALTYEIGALRGKRISEEAANMLIAYINNVIAGLS